MLYICATPIGNLADISYRAVEILNKADIILCEDTRNSKKLFNHYGISPKKLIALHEHNENEISHKVLHWLAEGCLIVQVSDAGTPSIADPGARLCNLVRQHGYPLSPLPGACAYASLLSVSGIMDAPSLFFGFLANKSVQRQEQLARWLKVDYAVAIYESPHRILACLNDIKTVLGSTRQLIMGRELTKQFETIHKSTIDELLSFVNNDANQQRGEFVLIILPPAALNRSNTNTLITQEQMRVLSLLSQELPAKKAVNLTHKIVGGNKMILYQYLLDKKMSA